MSNFIAIETEKEMEGKMKREWFFNDIQPS
jgi:hypothetical protein